jgi:hypothetical protein
MTTGRGAAERRMVIVGESAVTVGRRRLYPKAVHRAHGARLVGDSVDAVECIRTFLPELKEMVAGPLVFVADRHVTNCVGWAAA